MSSGLHTLTLTCPQPLPTHKQDNKTVFIVTVTVSKGTDSHFLTIVNGVLTFLVDSLANAIKIFTSLGPKYFYFFSTILRNCTYMLYICTEIILERFLL